MDPYIKKMQTTHITYLFIGFAYQGKDIVFGFVNKKRV
jgi:hypothetical protein